MFKARGGGASLIAPAKYNAMILPFLGWPPPQQCTSLVLDGFRSVLWVLPLRDPCLCCCGCLPACPTVHSSLSDWAFPFHLSASDDTNSDPSRCQTHLIISRQFDEEKSEALSHQDICRKPHSKRTLRWNTRRRLHENFPGCLARDQRLLFSNFWLTKLNYRIPIKVKILISETFFDTQNFNERWQTILVFRDVLFDVHCHHEIE